MYKSLLLQYDSIGVCHTVVAAKGIEKVLLSSFDARERARIGGASCIYLLFLGTTSGHCVGFPCSPF